MAKKNNDLKKPFFGIRKKMAVAVGLIVIVISALSFSLAVYLHILLTIDSAVRTNLYSGRAIVNELDSEVLTQIFLQGREIYDSIPEELRQDPLSEEYLAYFDELRTPEYEVVRQKLLNLAAFENLKWLDLRIGDSENCRWVYLMDTKEEANGRFCPGYWESALTSLSTFSETKDDPESELVSPFRPISLIHRLSYLRLQHLNRFSTVTEYYYPGTDEVIGYVGTGERFEDYRDDLTVFSILCLLAITVSLILVFILSDYLINRWLVRPLVSLSRAASNYATEKDKGRNIHRFESVTIHSKDELLLLKNSMVHMESDLDRYIADLSRMTAEKERSAAEMELSARIQTSLLPTAPEDHAGAQGFRLHALIDPAKEVGGDFYDYYTIDEDHLGITIADVSGKGFPAALFMVVAKTLLQNAGGKYTSPAEAVAAVNRQLCDQNQEMMFVTVFFGIYTISEKKLVYVNAGHENPALFRKTEDRFALIKEEHDCVVALMPETVFTEQTLCLEPGDKLFLYTDGIPDARNSKEDMFGSERMLESLNACKTLSGDAFLRRMRQDIRHFAGEADQFDDVTMLLLEAADSSDIPADGQLTT